MLFRIPLHKPLRAPSRADFYVAARLCSALFGARPSRNTLLPEPPSVRYNYAMPVNLDKPQKWKEDIAQSVDLYNDWFIKFAPDAFRAERRKAIVAVDESFRLTDNISLITPDSIRANITALPILRMACCPPIARDRLSGLSKVPKSFIDSLDKKKVMPPRLAPAARELFLKGISTTLNKLIDPDIFVWRGRVENPKPTERELERALTIVADRLCGANADPIIRNAQELRQLEKIKKWLEAKGYTFVASGNGLVFDKMKPGQFGFRVNVPVSVGAAELVEGETKDDNGVNIPVDVAIMQKSAVSGQLPLLIEAKSAGDFTNVNKRRKEEATKMQQLRATYGKKVEYVLFLCGYFDSGYLGYEAAEGIDWVWEHRMEDLAKFGL